MNPPALPSPWGSSRAVPNILPSPQAHLVPAPQTLPHFSHAVSPSPVPPLGFTSPHAAPWHPAATTIAPPADGRLRPRLPSPGLIPAATDGQTEGQTDRPRTCLLLPRHPRPPQPGGLRVPVPAEGAAGGGTAPAAFLPLCPLGTAERGRGRSPEPGERRRRGGPGCPAPPRGPAAPASRPCPCPAAGTGRPRPFWCLLNALPQPRAGGGSPEGGLGHTGGRGQERRSLGAEEWAAGLASPGC